MKSLVLNRRRLADSSMEMTATFNQANELMIYDIIMPYRVDAADTSVTPSQVMDFMDNAPTNFDVRINSAGGEVGAALAMYNRLIEHKGTVRTIVDGYAFSSAGWLALAGSDRQICNGGLFMMHNPYLYARIDSLNEIENVKNRWEAHRNSISDIFTTRTPMKADEVSNLMAAETYLSASEAVQKGLFHSVRNGVKAQTAMLNCLEIPLAAMNKADIERPDIASLQLRSLKLRNEFIRRNI